MLIPALRKGRISPLVHAGALGVLKLALEVRAVFAAGFVGERAGLPDTATLGVVLRWPAAVVCQAGSAMWTALAAQQSQTAHGNIKALGN